MKRRSISLAAVSALVLVLGPRVGPSAVLENAMASAERRHPLLFASAEEIARAKQRAAKHDWARAVYDGIIAGAERALVDAVEVPDRGGQWSHYYSCPKHGVRLKMESPTRHVCPHGGEVYSGWPYDDVAVTYTHHKYTADLENLGLAYAFTGDRRYAERAREILLAYAAKYAGYKIHDVRGGERASGGKRFAQTLDEAVSLVRVAWGYDLIYETLTPEDRERIETEFLRPSVEVILRNRAGKSNWQSWHNAGIAAVGFCLGDAGMIRTALDDPKHGFRYQMQASVLSDGSWYEGAPSYHFYALSALAYTSEAAHHAGINLYDIPAYKSLFDGPLDLVYPDLTFPGLNDADRFSLLGQERFYDLAYARYGGERYGAVVARGNRRNLFALLYGAETTPVDSDLAAGSVDLDGLGCAVLRDGIGADGRYLLLDYGPHGGGHGHPEKLQVLLYGLGQELAPDAGRLAYSVPMHGSWYRQTVAHNTIVVDQQSQQPTDGRLMLFHTEAGFQAARAVCTGAYEGVALDRTVIVLPDYIVDVYRAHSDAPHTYDWVYHNIGRVRADVTTFECRQPLGKDAGYQHLERLRRAQAPGAWRAAWQVEGGQVRLVAADGCGPAELFFADAPAQPPTTRMPLVICRREGEGAVFVSAIELVPRQVAHCVESIALKGWMGPPGARGLAIEVTTTDGVESFWIADDPETAGAQIVYVPAGGKKRAAP
ncbi:MAG: heparinase II/III family protein [Armatimonadota bacterium]|nr:MAG: heparinase II/III family protein [Armatimonadota bacterium]